MDRSLIQAPVASQELAPLQLEPVETRKKKKKKKKKKKEGMVSKIMSRLALGSVDAIAQVGSAIDDAARKYRKKHEKSREKQRDRWRKDLGKNVGSAAVQLLKGTAKAPGKLVKALVKKDRKRKKRDDEAVSVMLQTGAPSAESPAPGAT